MSVLLPGVGLITGAAAGIGRATAIAFATAGCLSLALVDKNESGLQETKRMILELLSPQGLESDIAVFQLDVTSAEDVATTFQSVKQHFGRLDYSVHAAGIALLTGPSPRVSVETFDLQTNILYRGVWLCSRAALNIMGNQSLNTEAYSSAGIHPTRAQRGAIVNISSTLGLQATAGQPGYVGAKTAVLGITRADAMDYASQGIRVNALLPGPTKTGMASLTREALEELEARATAATPMKRMAMPEEMADMIVFLASSRASYCTGACVCADGGLTAGFS